MLAVLAAVVIFVGAAVPAQAQTPTVLYRFPGFNGDACVTRGNIVQGRDGNMYGGGAAACGTGSGTIYKISPAGVESAFFIFPPQWLNCGGAGLTLGSDGNFYGTCISGNPATGMGSIFRLTPAGVFTDLHDFDGMNGDSLPVYPPTQASDGNFYGVSGNEVQVCGNIYKMTPAGVYTNLHTFVFNNANATLQIWSRPAMAIFMARLRTARCLGALAACTRSARQVFSKKFTASRSQPGRLHVPD